jgi:hypothetical protein
MSRTSMIATPIFVSFGAFCGFGFEAATLVWIVPMIAVAGIVVGFLSAWETGKRHA